MDRKKVTIIIIALAVILVMFLLYQYGKNKLETKQKLDGASADLEIQRANDEYLAEKEDAYRDRIVKEVTEGSYEDAYQQTTIAAGYSSLAEYRDSLTDGEKIEYDNDRSTYIEVMGKDPGLMSLDQLRKWYSDYSKWEYLNEQYIELTGESKSFLDPEFDTAAELKAAIKSAQTAIEIAQKEADDEWLEAYTQLNTGTDELGAFGIFDKAELKKYCPTTAELSAFHSHLMAMYLEWETNTKEKLIGYMKTKLYPAIVDDFKWSNSNHNNVDFINCYPADLCAEVSSMDPQSQLFLMSLYNSADFPEFKRVSQCTRVNSTRDQHDEKTFYTMTAAMRNRLTVSELAYTPANATSIDQVTSWKLTYDKPKHCGSDRSELVTNGKTANQNATNLLNMILTLEQTAKTYNMTNYGVAIRAGEYNKSILVDWATRLDNLN